ncbi:MAG TPA: O-antigen ligase family protein, partial [Bacteroidales bacterium]
MKLQLQKLVFALLLFFTMLVLVVPFVYSYDLFNGITSAKQIWFYLALSLILFFIAIGFFIGYLRISLGFNLIDLALLLFCFYCFLRAVTTPNVPVINNLKFTNLALCTAFYFVIKRLSSFDSLIKEGLSYLLFTIVLNVIIVTGLVQAIWGMMQLYGFLPSFNSNFKITGTFFNPAPYAMYLSLVLPMTLGVFLFTMDELKNEENESNEKNEAIDITRPEKSAKNILHYFHSLISSLTKFTILKHRRVKTIVVHYLALATLVAILLVLPATMIRAAWLGAFTGSLVVLQLKYQIIQQIKHLLSNRTRKVLVVAIVVLAGIIISGGLYLLKKDSANGKLLIWEVTLGKIAEKPVFGYGVGSFEAKYNDWQAGYFMQHPKDMAGTKGWVAGNTKYCFSDILEMTSEVGVVGLALFLVFIGTAGYLIMNEKLKIKNEELNRKRALDRTIFLSFIASFAVLLFFSFPLYSLPTLILLFVIMALYSARVKHYHVYVPLAPKMQQTIQSLFAGGCLVSAALLVIYGIGQYKAYYYWDEGDKLYTTSSYTDACKSFKKIYPEMQYDGLYLQYYGKAEAICGNYQQAITLLERAQRFTSDEVLYTNLGDCYKALQQYQQAEAAYCHAAKMVPHKLYPHYLLAKLYRQQGDTAKAYSKAIEVQNKKGKVESLAETEIK